MCYTLIHKDVDTKRLKWFKRFDYNRYTTYFARLALDYKSTATYYWSLIAENGFSTDSVTGFNDTKDATNNKVESSAGPFGFDEAILLGEEQVKIIFYHPF